MLMPPLVPCDDVRDVPSDYAWIRLLWRRQMIEDHRREQQCMILSVLQHQTQEDGSTNAGQHCQIGKMSARNATRQI